MTGTLSALSVVSQIWGLTWKNIQVALNYPDARGTGENVDSDRSSLSLQKQSTLVPHRAELFQDVDTHI